MRAALAFSVSLALVLGADAAGAEPRVLQVAPSDSASAAAPSTAAGFETYRGFTYDLSEYRERKDFDALEDNLKRQLDMVENAGLSPKVMRFFHSVPIIASEMTCMEEGAAFACYGFIVPDRDRRGTRGITTWDHDKQQWTNPDTVQLAADSGIGVIMLSPIMTRHAEDPIVLHEFLHAYHAKLMPNGFENKGIKGFFAYAKAKDLLPKDTYALKNQQEFFAVTASIFLAGKESVHEPKTRANLKEKMPDYYKYLVDLFGFDPDAPTGTPVASAELRTTQ
jgi:toxin lethal factor